MKMSLLSFLQCPDCGSDFTVRVEREDAGEVMEGVLQCSCTTFPILRGVPRMLPQEMHVQNWETARRFGEEWNQFSEMNEQYEEQFLSWIEPVRRDHFIGKTVLDVGCGKGRHILQAKKFGASIVVGVDLSHAVDAAFQNTGRLDGVHIIQTDVYRLPFKPVFDYAYSIGVLHHTPDPARSFQCMVDQVKSGGSVSAWVYGREGNDWIIYGLNPIRRITSWLPMPMTKAIAFCLTLVLQTLLITLYRPAVRYSWLKRRLPYSSYLCSISGYTFRENFLIVLDHLIPGIAFYIREEEFRGWFERASLEQTIITRRYGNSWRGFAVKLF